LAVAEQVAALTPLVVREATVYFLTLSQQAAVVEDGTLMTAFQAVLVVEVQAETGERRYA